MPSHKASYADMIDPGEALQGPLTRLDSDSVYLTFDDGPDSEFTPAVLDALAAAKVHATFFVIGQAAQAQPALVRRIAAAGHEIGNHGFSHRHPWSLSNAQALQDFQNGHDAITDIVGAAPRWFRPPHGRLRAGLRTRLQALGHGIVLWSVSAVDWGPLGVSNQIRRRLDNVAAGDIVLMHDGRHRHNQPDQLLAVLPAFLNHLNGMAMQCALLPEYASSVCSDSMKVTAAHDSHRPDLHDS